MKKQIKIDGKYKEIELTEQDKKDLKNQSAKKYNHKRNISKYKIIEHIKEWWKNKYRKSYIFLIEMYLRNGKMDRFTIVSKTPYFKYHGGTYFLDQDLAIHDLHSGLRCLSYHEDCAIPFKVEINVDKLKKAITKNTAEDGISERLNPRSIGGFIKTEVIEKVMKGQELSKEMYFIKIMVIIGVLLQGIMFLLIGKSQGWF